MQEIEDILKKLVVFLKQSEDSIWSDLTVSEVLQILEKQLLSLEAKAKVKTRQLRYLFLPTAPLQEIALHNGWSDEYLEVAEQFDRWLEKQN